MPPSAHVVLLEERADGAYLVPSGPVGAWVRRPLCRILGALEEGTPLVLDLARAPISTPVHVAAVLWICAQATQRGLPLAIEAPDMISAELLAFSGIDAAVEVAQRELDVAPVADGTVAGSGAGGRSA